MRAGIGAIAFACAALSGCSPERPAAAAPTSLGIRSISVQTNSWGKPITDWTIRRDGQSSYSFSSDLPGGGFRDYDLVTKSFTASAADFAKVESLLTAAHAFAGGEIPCRVALTDGIYGHIAWSEGGEPRGVSFNFGCLSRTAEAVYSGLRDAEGHMQKLADGAEIVEVKQVREPRG